jgi:hypothetical protein
MIVLPRSITSPSVVPSRGTGAPVSGLPTWNCASVGIGTPCRAIFRARSVSDSADHSSCHAHSVAGPYDSVSPYRCVTRKPIASMASMTADGGAAPPVATSTGWPKAIFTCAGACTSRLSTIGAPHMCVTRWSRIAGKISAGSTRRRHTCVPPAAVTAHVYVQPQQWNIGSVHR